MNGKQLKNSILQWAIQGKLVPQDPNDEPASVLLERIRAEKAKLIKEKKLKKDKNESIIYRGDDNSYYEKFLATGEVKCIDEEIPFEIPEGWEWCRLNDLALYRKGPFGSSLTKSMFVAKNKHSIKVYEQIDKETKEITEDILFDLPNKWQWCRIGTIFMHNNGKQLNKGNSKGKLMKYITTSNLYWDGFVLDNLKEMPFENNEIDRCMAVKGDLLVCEGGDIGRSCIWNYDFPIMLQNHIHKLRPYIPLCTKFFYYIFNLYNLAGLIGGKGIGIQGFSSKALHNTLVPLPPLKEQYRIVTQIEKLFEQLR